MKNWFNKTGTDVPDLPINNNEGGAKEVQNQQNNNGAASHKKIKTKTIDIKQSNYLSANIKVYESEDEEEIDLNNLSNILHNDSNELQSQLNFLTAVYSELLKHDNENIKANESVTVIGKDITILAGTESGGDSDGYSLCNKLNNINGLTMKDSSTLLFADTNNKKIKSVNLKNGYVSTLKSLDYKPMSIDFNTTGELYIASKDLYYTTSTSIKKVADKETQFALGKLSNYPRDVVYSLNESSLVITDVSNGNKGTLNLPLLLKANEITSLYFCCTLYICTLSNIYNLNMQVKADAFRSSLVGSNIQSSIELLDINWVNIAGCDDESGYLDGAYYHALLRPMALCFAKKINEVVVNEPGTNEVQNSLSPGSDICPNIFTHTLYFLDGSNTLRARSPDGLIYTLLSPDPSYTPIAYGLHNPRAILAVETNEFENIIYVADENRILKIDVVLEKKPCLFPLSLVPTLPDGKIIEERYTFNEIVDTFASTDKSTPLEHENDDEVITLTPVPSSTKYKLSMKSSKFVALKATPIAQERGRTSAQNCLIS